MSAGTLVVKLSFVGVVSLTLPLHGHIDWDWWFSYGNLTANYARVTCVTEGVDRRPEYEARVRTYLAKSDTQRSQLTRVEQYELFIAWHQLTDALHAAMVDEYLTGRSYFLRADDQQLLIHLQDVAKDQHFRSANDDNTRGEVALSKELEEVKDHIAKNIERIAHPPKIALLCASLVGIAYWLYLKYGDKITQLAAQAEEKVETEVVQAGHELAHQITNLAHEIEGSDEKHA